MFLTTEICDIFVVRNRGVRSCPKHNPRIDELASSAVMILCMIRQQQKEGNHYGVTSRNELKLMCYFAGGAARMDT